MKRFTDMLAQIDNIVWGVPTIAIILVCGIYFTVRLKGIQFRRLRLAMKLTMKRDSGEGEVSAFGALCASLAATIGTGNIIGVASAIALGGPGALFWMMIAALAGMATKYAESLLAVKYRSFDSERHALGGPFYYIEKGMGRRWRWLAKLFALCGASAGLFGIGTFTQVSGITSSVQSYFDPRQEHILFAVDGRDMTFAVVVSGLVVGVLSACVLIGGIKRIVRVSEIVIPFVGILFVGFNLTAILLNIRAVPNAFREIVRGAFGWDAAAGGTVGAMMMAMQKGVSRGIFSNEAGMGTAPIAAAAAKTDDAAHQGLVMMMGTFIDTVVMCMMTGLVIVMAGSWKPELGLEGVDITVLAFQRLMPFSPRISSFMVMLSLVIFAFTTIIGWNYYAERCFAYLTDERSALMKIYRAAYAAAVFVGPYLTVGTVWMIADIFNGLMVLPNMIALFALSGTAAKLTADFYRKQKRTDLQ